MEEGFRKAEQTPHGSKHALSQGSAVWRRQTTIQMCPHAANYRLGKLVFLVF